MPRPLLTSSDLAEIFQVTPETVTRWVREGRIPALKAPGGGGYRFRQADVDALLGVPDGPNGELAS